MMEFPSLAEQAVERILELSADLQIKRRATAKYSFEFNEYSVAIAAYGKALEVLTALLHKKLCSPDLGLLGALESSREAQAVI
jgi:hypothetical protein